MIKRDRRDYGCRRGVNDVGGIHAPAQSGFKQQDIGRNPRKGKKGCGLGDFKEGNGFAAIDGFDFGQKIT